MNVPKAQTTHNASITPASTCRPIRVTLTRLSTEDIEKHQKSDNTARQCTPSSRVPTKPTTVSITPCKVLINKLALSYEQTVILKQPRQIDTKPVSKEHKIKKPRPQSQSKSCTHTFSMKKHVLKRRHTKTYLKCRVQGCSMAYVSFSTVRNATAHHRLHHPNTTFNCSKCAKILMTPNSLHVHMYHHKEMQYKCDSCDQTFVYKSKLK